MYGRLIFTIVAIGSVLLSSCSAVPPPPPMAEVSSHAARPGTDFELQEGEYGFAFVSRADGEPNAAGQRFVMFMSGSGVFDEQRAEGGGTFDLWDIAQERPQTITAAGHWRIERRVDFTLPDIPVTGAGVSQSGILDVAIRLYPVDGPADGIPANLRIVCNVPAIPAMTGLPEGVFVEIEEFPGFAENLAFAPATFPETSFPLGLTTFLRQPNTTPGE